MDTGRKFNYLPEKLDEILSAIDICNGSLGTVADYCGLNRDNFYYWMRTGDEHRKIGKSSDVAQLSNSVRKEQSKVVIKLSHAALADEKKVKFVTWWLSKILREDFGLEGMEIKELRDIFKVLLPLINGANNGNGNIDSGKAQENIKE